MLQTEQNSFSAYSSKVPEDQLFDSTEKCHYCGSECRETKPFKTFNKRTAKIVNCRSKEHLGGRYEFYVWLDE